jgi:DNA-binding winged helix-turn-helix (wHTH) protein
VLSHKGDVDDLWESYKGVSSFKMVLKQQLRFGPFELDPRVGLKRGNRLLHLTPKALAVIAELASRSGEIVTKDELFDAVWPDTTVSDAALVTCIQEIRQALRDNVARPRFIETVHRRGYRFLHPLEKQIDTALGHRATTDRSRLLVGRAKELEELDAVLARAQRGVRQIIFVSGEAGIGKTSLVEAFLNARLKQDLQLAFGQSVERHETSEAYQPLLEALTRWGRQSDGKPLLAVLERHAPTWLAQLPSLLPPERLRQFERRTAGSTRDRMLRELTEALEAAATTKPLILFLEDLHWADVSTLDWLATFARRREPTTVLVVATDRPFEATTTGHPLRAIKRELLAQGCASELVLRALTHADTFDYLRTRFPPAPGMDDAMAGLAVRIHGHTEGRPLLMASVADELVAQGQLAGTERGWIVETAGAKELPVPRDIDRIVEGRLEKLDGAARLVLETASVGGVRVSAAALATAARPAGHRERGAVRIHRCEHAADRRGRRRRMAGWYPRQPVRLCARALSRRNLQAHSGGQAAGAAPSDRAATGAGVRYACGRDRKRPCDAFRAQPRFPHRLSITFTRLAKRLCAAAPVRRLSAILRRRCGSSSGWRHRVSVMKPRPS